MEKRNQNGLTEAEFLANYKPGNYERPSMTADVLVFTIRDRAVDVRKIPEKDLQILLVRRKDHPFIDCFAIPGGFVNIHESIEEAARRELFEETGVRDVYMEQLYTFGDVGRDPRMRVITTSYLALVPSGRLKPKAGDDAAEVAWFTVRQEKVSESEDRQVVRLTLENEELGERMEYLAENVYGRNGVIKTHETNMIPVSQEGLAFDHAKIIYRALERIRNKVEYTPIAFNLVPDEFTRGELEKVYETLLGKELFSANFRKRISHLIEDTGHMTENGWYRPSKLYRYRFLQQEKE